MREESSVAWHAGSLHGAQRPDGPLLTAPRFEVLPFERALGEAAALSEPVALTVTSSPRHGPDEAVAIGARLRELGHQVTVHISARMVRDREHAGELLERMAQAGIDDAFVIGGDAKEPVGAYASAAELLRDIAAHPARPSWIGIAGYPEGHPLIDGPALEAALAEKAPAADYVTTQMCFDPEAIIRWLEGTRAQGVTLPVLIGVPGEVDRRRLLEISMRIGVGSSLSFLRKQRGLRHLLSRSSPAERLVGALAPAVGERELGVVGFHYFTFNQLVDTWNWDREQRESCELATGS
jgi:methylenetetrahydrofolate reductase (NADH)